MILSALQYSKAQQFTINRLDPEDEIRGCSCAFSLSKVDYENRKYIYVEDFEYGWISIDGKKNQFLLNHSVYGDGSYCISFGNEDYVVDFNLTSNDLGVELTEYRGTMKIKKRSTQEEKTIKLYGHCGC